MKQSCQLHLTFLGCLFLLVGTGAFAQNLLTNPGWDSTTGSVTLGEGQAAQFDSTTFTDWQVFSVGTGTSTFSVQADPNAVSPPNLMVFNKNWPDDAGIRRDTVPATVTPGHCYLSSAFGRDVEGALDTLISSTFIFGPNVGVGAGNMVLSADWSKIESSWICPASGTETSLQASFQFRLHEFDGSVQIDSCVLEDITDKNRMTNSGFENSDTAPVLWDTFAVGGDTTTATISNDSHEGNNALLLQRTSAGGDAGINKDAHLLPWNGADKMEVTFYAKDDPTIASGEHLLTMVCCWDATGTIQACEAYTLPVGAGSYKLTGAVYSPPASTARVTVGFRIVNSGGVAMTGDVLIDDVVVGDLNAGFVSRIPPEHIEGNLLTNPGWDLTTASITLENGFDSGVTFPDWQIYAIPEGINSTFTSLADAGAISAPNIFVFSKNVDGGDSACRRDSALTSVFNGFVYKYGVHVRDTDASATNLNLGMVLLGTPNVSPTGVNMTAASEWELAEDSFIVPLGYTKATLQLRVGGSFPAALQLDSSFVEDITQKDRMTNGGFENSDSRVLLWDTFAVGGDTTTASISNDSHKGNNALLLQRTAVTGGDAGINKDGHLLPWKGSDKMEVTFYAKDEPTLATGEHLLVMVCCWDSGGAIVHCEAYNLEVGTSAYKLAGAVFSPPATTAKVTVGFRIVNSSGAGITGDVLIDDVVVGDLDEGFPTNIHPEHTEGNILTNPGWDLTTGTIFMDGNFDGGATFTDWQVYAINGDTATFTAEAAGDAISSPNIFTFTKHTTGGDSACRRDTAMTAVTPTFIYKYGVNVRDTDTTPTTMNMGMVLFPAPLAFATGVNLEATTAWELAEDSFLVDNNHSLGSFQLRMSGSVPASLQFDSAFIEDVSLKNRMTNGGFENSDSRVLLWDPFAAGGDAVTASLSNDAHEGTNALLLERTAAGGDAGINKDLHRLPWKGDNKMEVSFYAKDKPTLATGEHLLVMVCCWNSIDAIVGCEAFNLSVGPSAYLMNGHVYSPPAATAKVTVGFRIVDETGAAMTGDVLIDDVVVGDLDDGFEPRLEPTAITDWAQY